IDQRPPHSGKRDQPAAVGVDRARPSGREDERLDGHELNRSHLQQHFRGEIGDHLLVGKSDAGHESALCWSGDAYEIVGTVGWVEPLRNPSWVIDRQMTGFAALYPSYD